MPPRRWRFTDARIDCFHGLLACVASTERTRAAAVPRQINCHRVSSFRRPKQPEACSGPMTRASQWNFGGGGYADGVGLIAIGRRVSKRPSIWRPGISALEIQVSQERYRRVVRLRAEWQSSYIGDLAGFLRCRRTPGKECWTLKNGGGDQGLLRWLGRFESSGSYDGTLYVWSEREKNGREVYVERSLLRIMFEQNPGQLRKAPTFPEAMNYSRQSCLRWARSFPVSPGSIHRRLTCSVRRVRLF